MRIRARAVLASIATFGLIGTALAADLTGAEIKTLISGNSVYIETSAASVTGKAGQGIIESRVVTGFVIDIRAVFDKKTNLDTLRKILLQQPES